MPRRTRLQIEEDARRARRRRVSHVTRTYGISEDQLVVLEEYQGGKCYGCRRATGASKALAVDHNHRTGEVRMLLCSTCNQIVGHFRDSPQALIRLGLALIQPPSRAAWTAPGRAEPGWLMDDPELTHYLEDR